MPEYGWPDKSKRKLIGTRQSRVDGPVKVSGRAKYTFDLNRPGMLFAELVRSPYPHCRIKDIDTSAAEKMPGVRAVHIIQKPGTEIQWAGDEIVAIAADTEQIAFDAGKAVKVTYETLEHKVIDDEPPRNIQVSDAPLTEDDFFGLLDNQVPIPEIVGMIQKNGIAWKPAEAQLKQFGEWGIPKPLIDALAKATVKEGPVKPSWYKKSAAQTQGEPDAAFKAPDAVISEGLYGMPMIAHCCLEPHGTVTEWPDPKNLNVYISTQNVSGIAGQMAEPIKVPAANIHVHMDHVGGGFGSKFGPDRWGIVCAELSRKAGKPVKFMLDRRSEMEIAGARPSAYARVRVAAGKDGKITAWQSESWGSGGVGGGGQPPIPYVFEIPNRRTQHTAVVTNTGPARAWRAPNHPQACLVTLAALDDLADKLGMDPIEFLDRNLDITGPRTNIYREELRIAAELAQWKKLWRPRSQNAGSRDSIKRGLGVSLHTWGGRGHNSECDLTIHPDGSVEIKMGSQDLGTGTRTAIMMVAADTLGIPMSHVNLLVGDNKYPPSGGSGGSTTIGGVSASTRRAAVDARDQLLARVAPALKAQPAELEIVDGVVRVIGAPDRAFSWKQACAKLGPNSIAIRGRNPDRSKPPDLTAANVGGVQIADVSIDTETGIVRVNRMVAVQDCGLVVNLKTAESQVYGALIMGITYALYEEKVMDPTTGLMLNPNMEFYRLAGIGDIGELVVHMMQTPEHEKRGVIGLGEPPVISPGAAISNAVANALGIRVPFLPFTPDRVLAALERKDARA